MDKLRRVLLIALDAAEPELVERWMADGSLPNLRNLRRIGLYGRLASSAKWLTGSPWPTFFTGRSPADHGVYQFLQWRADEMQARRPTPDWLPVQPFWRDFGRDGRRAITLDIPQTYSPEPFDGIEITGWASHDTLAPPGAYPAAIMDWCGARSARHRSVRKLIAWRPRPNSCCSATNCAPRPSGWERWHNA